MKVLRLEVPGELAEEIGALVKAEWFDSENQIARLALREFIGRQRFALSEQFQWEDIAWALSSVKAEP